LKTSYLSEQYCSDEIFANTVLIRVKARKEDERIKEETARKGLI